jgi:hypothetical protein
MCLSHVCLIILKKSPLKRLDLTVHTVHPILCMLVVHQLKIPILQHHLFVI